MGCHTRHYFYSAEKQKEWRDFVVRSFTEMTQKCYDGLSEDSFKENFDFYHSLYIRSVSSAKEFLNAYNIKSYGSEEHSLQVSVSGQVVPLTSILWLYRNGVEYQCRRIRRQKHRVFCTL